MEQLLGGWSKTMPATKDIQKICDQVKERVEEMVRKDFLEFKAVEYRNQIVAGENYIIKVCVGGEDYIHLSLFQTLQCDGGKIVVRGLWSP